MDRRRPPLWPHWPCCRSPLAAPTLTRLVVAALLPAFAAPALAAVADGAPPLAPLVAASLLLALLPDGAPSEEAADAGATGIAAAGDAPSFPSSPAVSSVSDGGGEGRDGPVAVFAPAVTFSAVAVDVVSVDFSGRLTRFGSRRPRQCACTVCAASCQCIRFVTYSRCHSQSRRIARLRRARR